MLRVMAVVAVATPLPAWRRWLCAGHEHDPFLVDRSGRSGHSSRGDAYFQPLMCLIPGLYVQTRPRTSVPVCPSCQCRSYRCTPRTRFARGDSC